MEKKGSVLMDKYELGRLLGQGTFAKVHQGRDLKTGAGVAIKIIDKEKVLRVGLMDRVETEISAMRMIRHPNVVELHEVMASKSKIYFVMEYAKGGDLFNKLTKGRLRPEAARKYFCQLIAAVDYCHSRGVAHRDLKPENLLLDEAGDLKVSDFGLSALAESRRQDGLLHTTCGTPAYVAPEVISRLGYDGSTADVWSCGVVLFVLLAGYLPFYDSNLMEMYKKIMLGDFKVPSWFSPESRKLVMRMLDPNPRTRASMERILASSWVRRGLRRSTATVDRGDDLGVREWEEPTKPCHLNAFDIISYSSGFDLSGLFVDAERKREVRFTSDKAAPTIMSSLEEIAKRLRLGVKKRAGGLVRLEASKEGRKGVMAIDAEIYEITPSFHLVEMNKVTGDTLEYHKTMNQDIRPALKDIIWSWQGEREPPSPPQIEPPSPPQIEELEPSRPCPSELDSGQASE